MHGLTGVSSGTLLPVLTALHAAARRWGTGNWGWDNNETESYRGDGYALQVRATPLLPWR